MKYVVPFFTKRFPLFIALCAVCMGIWSRWYGFDGMYGQDAYNYFRQLKQFPFYPQAEFWPIGFSVLAQPFRWLPGGDFFALQACSLFAWACLGCLLWQYSRFSDISGRAAFFWVLGWLSSPLWLRSAFLGMSDTSACLGIGLVLICIISSSPERWLWLAVVGTVVAVLSRFVSVAILTPAWLWLLYRGVVHRQWKGWHFGVCALGIFLVTIHVAFLSSSEGSIQHPWVEQWDLRNAFSRTFAHQDGRLAYALPNALFILVGGLHPGFGVGLWVWICFVPAKQRTGSWKTILVMALVYAVFLMGVPYQNLRFILPLSLLLYILGFPGFVHLLERFPRFTSLAWLVLLPLFAFPRALQPFLERQQFEQTLAERMKPYSGSTLYTFDVDAALLARGYIGNVINLWQGPVNRFQPGALVLYHPTRFRKQWRDAWPEKNFYHVCAIGYDTLETLPLGWRLYKIKYP